MFNASRIAKALEQDLLFIKIRRLLDKDYLDKKTVEYMIEHMRKKK